MYLGSLHLLALVSSASSLYIKPGLESYRHNTRASPQFLNESAPLTGLTASNYALAKRTDPTLWRGDFGETTDGAKKKGLLEGAFPDVYTLVWTVLNKQDPKIFDHWFPPRDTGKVFLVLSKIIEDRVRHFPAQERVLSSDRSQNVPVAEVKGSEILKNVYIAPYDPQLALPEDQQLCTQGAAAYTLNFNPTDGDPSTPNYAIQHFCDGTYEDFPDDDGDVTEVAPKLSDLQLDDFKFGDEYRITNEMESIAATVLHELIHFNTIGEPSGLPDVSPFPSNEYFEQRTEC